MANLHNLGNTQKNTLVLNFYAFSCRKNTCNLPHHDSPVIGSQTLHFSMMMMMMSWPTTTPMPTSNKNTINNNLASPHAVTDESTVDRLWMTMQTTMTTMTTINQLVLHDSLHTIPQPAPINPTSPTLRFQDTELKHPSPHEPMPMMLPNDNAAYPTIVPCTCHLTTTPATSLMLMQTHMQWLLNNQHHQNTALWMPDIIYHRLTQNLQPKIINTTSIFIYFVFYIIVEYKSTSSKFSEY